MSRLQNTTNLTGRYGEPDLVIDGFRICHVSDNSPCGYYSEFLGRPQRCTWTLKISFEECRTKCIEWNTNPPKGMLQDFIPCTGYEFDGLDLGQCSLIKAHIPPPEPQCPEDPVAGDEGHWALIPSTGSFPQADHGTEICKYDSTSTMHHDVGNMWFICYAVYPHDHLTSCDQEPQQGRTCP